MSNIKNIRLWVDKNLASTESLALDARQSHYLSNVMRCQQGDVLRCFNAKNGEFECRIVEINKTKTMIEPLKKCRDPEQLKDVWLLFSPLKKDKTDFVIEKAVELGAVRIIPIITSRTNANQIKIERYMAQAIEAAEQCDRLNVPEISAPIDLKNLLMSWDKDRIIYFADERRHGQSAFECFKKSKNCQSALLIGPEGGFSDDEAEFINKQGFTQNISLGPRILRAETAAIASLAVWQSAAGDW